MDVFYCTEHGLHRLRGNKITSLTHRRKLQREFSAYIHDLADDLRLSDEERAFLRQLLTGGTGEGER